MHVVGIVPFLENRPYAALPIEKIPYGKDSLLERFLTEKIPSRKDPLWEKPPALKASFRKDSPLQKLPLSKRQRQLFINP